MFEAWAPRTRSHGCDCLLRRLVPFLLAAMDQCLAVIRQNPAFLHQFVGGLTETAHVVVVPSVSFRNRFARVVGFLTFGSSLPEWNVRDLESNPLIRRANRRVTEIPGGIRSQ